MTMINNSFLVTLLVIAVLTANVCYRSNNVNIPTVIFQDPTNTNKRSSTSSSSSSSFIRRRIRKLQSENEEEEEEAPVESSEQTQDESNDAEEADIESTPGLDENQDEPVVEEAEAEPVSETHDEDTVIDGVDVDSVAEEYSEEIMPEEESQEEEEEEEVVDEPAEEAGVETNEEINEEPNTEYVEEEVNEETQQLDEEAQPQEGTIDEENTESVEEEEEVNEEIQQLDEEVQPQDESTEETANEMNDEIDETETNENVDEESDANSVEPSESMEDFQADEPKEEIVEVDTDIEENDEIKTEWQDTDSVEPESNEESQSEEDEEEATEEAITETHDEGNNEANEANDVEESNTDSIIPESTEDVQPIETQEVEEITESYDETNAEESNTESTIDEFNEEFQSEENPNKTAGFDDQSPSDELQYDQIQEESAEEPLIDFAIAGFPKSGTTYLLQAVLNVSQVYMGWPTDQTLKEVHDLEHGQHFVQKFINRYDLSKHPNYFNGKYKYHRIYNEEKVINGFKAPMLVEHTHGLQNLFNLAPDVDFVMTTRHPVLWFQSFWNFRARDGRNMPSPLDLIGNCDTGCDPDDSNCKVGASSNAQSVCTGAAKFHHYLAKLKFTPMNTPEELDLLSLRHSTFDFTGRMFIIEVSQMSDENLDRLDRFRSELTDFLGLKLDTLPSLTTAKDEYDVLKRSPEYLLLQYKHIEPNLSQSQKERFGDVDMTENMDTELVESMLHEAAEKIDICEEKYAPLRQRLVNIGSNAATWIEDYLLESPRVVVANKDNFIGLINLWKLDPCDKENESVSRARERGLLEWDHVIHEGY